MEFDFSQTGAAERYKLMSAAITPRPIAWVTSLSSEGTINAAPFSFFNMMSSDPPLIVLGIVRRADGSFKDTARNILDRGEFVVHLVSEADATSMNFTSIDSPPDFDEIEHGEIATARSVSVAPPRIVSAPVAMECRLFEQVEVGTATIFLGQVLHFHIDDRLIDAERLHVDTEAMRLVSRMHGAGWYLRSTDQFKMLRPDFADWKPAVPIVAAGSTDAHQQDQQA